MIVYYEFSAYLYHYSEIKLYRSSQSQPFSTRDEISVVAYLTGLTFDPVIKG